GIEIVNSSDNQISSNDLGLDAIGGRGTKRMTDGVLINGGSNNRIGGAGLGNSIGGNDFGIRIIGNAKNTKIDGNNIGVGRGQSGSAKEMGLSIGSALDSQSGRWLVS